MEFLNEYITMWKNYANFKGRTSVKGYWMAFLVNVIIAIVLGILTSIIGIIGIVSMLYSLAGLVPGIALTIRRLHDTGKSGWFCLISLIPLVGAILLIVVLCKPSATDNNPFLQEALV